MTNSSTRIPRREVLDLCETIYAQNPDLPVLGARVLGLFLCVRLTLTYLRRNPCQELLAEFYGIWQPTASRVIGAYTPLIAAALDDQVPVVKDRDPVAQHLVRRGLTSPLDDGRRDYSPRGLRYVREPLSALGSDRLSQQALVRVLATTPCGTVREGETKVVFRVRSGLEKVGGALQSAGSR